MSELSSTPDVSLDAVNLERALRDFEIANARVIDLTTRLTTLNQELITTTTELHMTKLKLKASNAKLERTRSRLAAVERSKPYRMVRVASQAVKKIAK